jgi:hypothetical protein
MVEQRRLAAKGRLLVATRHIPRGSTVLTDAAVAFVPAETANGAYATALVAALCLAMARTPTLAGEVRELCAATYEGDGDERAIGVAAAAAAAQRRLAQQHGLHVALDELTVLFRQVAVNAFTAVNGDFTVTIGVGLYLRAAAINHSCEPNCCQSFVVGDGVSPSPHLLVRSTRDIVPGEEITIAYVDVGRPTATRRRELQASYGFFCTCARCSASNRSDDAGLLCGHAGCAGALDLMESDVFRAWKSGGVRVPTPPAGPSSHMPLPLPLPLPHAEMWGTTITVPAAPGVRFLCASCARAEDAAAVRGRFADLCRRVETLRRDKQRLPGPGARSGAQFVDDCRAAVAALGALVDASANPYPLVDLLRNYLLEELIVQQRFDEYVRAATEHRYVSRLRACYPPGAAIVAVQSAMLGKVLLLVAATDREVRAGRDLLCQAADDLKVCYGEDNPAYRDVRDQLMH